MLNVEAKITATDLVMLQYREVQADDTMREWHQILRFDLIDKPGYPLKSQIFWDRRHKFNRGMSEHVGYFRMGSTEQLIRLANTALALAVVIGYSESGQLEPLDEQIKRCLDAHWQMAVPDILNTVKLGLADLQLHRRAREESSK